MRKICFAVASLVMMLHSPIVRGDDQLPPPVVFVKTFLQLSDQQLATLNETTKLTREYPGWMFDRQLADRLPS